MSQWWTYRGNPKRTGAVREATAVQGSSPLVDWSTTLNNAENLPNTLRVTNGYVVIGHSDGFSVLDRETGEEEWNQSRTPPTRGLFVREGIVLADQDEIWMSDQNDVRQAGPLCEMGIESGGALCPFPLEDYAFLHEKNGTACFDAIAHPSDGGIMAMGFVDDHQDLTINGRPIPPIVISSGHIYVRAAADNSSHADRIVALTKSPEPLEFGQDIRHLGPPIAGPDGGIYFFEYEGGDQSQPQGVNLRKVALDADREELHESYIGYVDIPIVSPMAVNKTSIFYCSRNGIIVKRSLDGDIEWQVEMQSSEGLHAVGPVVLSDCVYVGTQNTLYGFDSAGGKILEQSFDEIIRGIAGSHHGLFVATRTAVHGLIPDGDRSEQASRQSDTQLFEGWTESDHNAAKSGERCGNCQTDLSEYNDPSYCPSCGKPP